MLGAYAILGVNSFKPNVSYFTQVFDVQVQSPTVTVQGYPLGMFIDYNVGSNPTIYVANNPLHSIQKIVTDLKINSVNPYHGSVRGLGLNQNWSPMDCLLDYNQNLFISEGGNTIKKIEINTTGIETPVYVGHPTGDSGYSNGTPATFRVPRGMAVDSNNNIYIADSNHVIRKIDYNGVVSTFAGISAKSDGTYNSITGSTDGVGYNARFNEPSSITIDLDDNIYVSDTRNHTIRKITLDGTTTTIAGSAGNAGWADGIGSEARFHTPNGLCCDFDGNIYVCDSENFVIRKLTKIEGTTPTKYNVTTIAGTTGESGDIQGDYLNSKFNWPHQIKMMNNGDLLVSETGSYRIKKIKNSTGYKNTFNITLSSNRINLNLEKLLLRRGWNGTDIITCNLTILNGVYVYAERSKTSNDNIPALYIGPTLNGSTITITNSGSIVGAGGIHRADASTLGTDGTDALIVKSNITLKNYGTIGGGGGAGGAAGAFSLLGFSFNNEYMVVGGDGAGKSPKTNPTSRFFSIAGSPLSWSGGTAGNLGENGNSGTCPSGGTAQNGTLAGKAINGISFVTIDSSSTGVLKGARV